MTKKTMHRRVEFSAKRSAGLVVYALAGVFLFGTMFPCLCLAEQQDKQLDSSAHDCCHEEKSNQQDSDHNSCSGEFSGLASSEASSDCEVGSNSKILTLSSSSIAYQIETAPVLGFGSSLSSLQEIPLPNITNISYFNTTAPPWPNISSRQRLVLLQQFLI